MIPLVNHSSYTLLKGASDIDNLLETAKNFKVNSMALTDENGMYGLIPFIKKAIEAGIKPLAGAQIDDRLSKNLRAVFLPRNNDGYKELCKIITSRRLNENFSLAEAVKNSSNFFILTDSPELLKIIGNSDNLYIQLKPSHKFRKHNRILYNYAVENNIRLAASNSVYFCSRGDYILHKVLTAIRLNTTLDNIPADELESEDSFFTDPADAEHFFRALPEAVLNTYTIADNCNLDLKLNDYKFPVFSSDENEDSFSQLWRISFEGLRRRYKPVTKAARERLEMELEVIRELGFADYFLVVWDIVREAKKRGMMMIGRGSAANSIVAYCLELTQVDPIKYNLYFERFLNKGRSSPPDVDIDFSWKERDEIVKYVFEKYGYEKVAMISTHVTFRARSAFRETAKVFGFTDNEISKYSKFIPWTNAQNLPDLAALFPESKSLNFKDEPWKTIINIASRLAGFPRHLSIHPGGIIITPGPITDYVALEYASNKGLGLIITQPDMYSIEDLGLIKIDLLSQRSLGVLRDTLSRIKKSS